MRVDTEMNFFEPETEEEPPLLEELGIDPALVLRRAAAVWRSNSATVLGIGDEPDLAGPTALGLAVVVSALACGRANIVYLLALAGILLLWGLANALTCGEGSSVSLTDVTSVLGYCLQPVAILSFLKTFAIPLGTGLLCAALISMAAVLGASAASRTLAVAVCRPSVRPLLAYPCALLYAGVALLSVF